MSTAPAWNPRCGLRVAFDTLESIRRFEPAGQRSCAEADEAEIVFAGEAVLDAAAVARFRRRYLEAFGVPGPRDPIFANLAEGRRHSGFEHWLPFLHDRLATLLDYLPGAPVLFDEMAEEAFGERQGLIADLYSARLEFQAEAERRLLPIYRAHAPEALYLDREELAGHLASRPVRNLIAGRIPVGANAVDAGGRPGRSFAAERIDSGADVFLAVGQHVNALRQGGRGVLLAAFSEGSLERTALSLADSAGIEARRVDGWRAFEGGNGDSEPPVAIAVWRLSAGYTTDSVAVISEEDIFGDRFVARGTRPRRSQAAGERIRELEELEPEISLCMPSSGSAASRDWRRWKPMALHMIASLWNTRGGTCSGFPSRIWTSCTATGRARGPSSIGWAAQAGRRASLPRRKTFSDWRRS